MSLVTALSNSTPVPLPAADWTLSPQETTAQRFPPIPATCVCAPEPPAAPARPALSIWHSDSSIPASHGGPRFPTRPISSDLREPARVSLLPPDPTGDHVGCGSEIRPHLQTSPAPVGTRRAIRRCPLRGRRRKVSCDFRQDPARVAAFCSNHPATVGSPSHAAVGCCA